MNVNPSGLTTRPKKVDKEKDKKTDKETDKEEDWITLVKTKRNVVYEELGTSGAPPGIPDEGTSE